MRKKPPQSLRLGVSAATSNALVSLDFEEPHSTMTGDLRAIDIGSSGAGNVCFRPSITNTANC